MSRGRIRNQRRRKTIKAGRNLPRPEYGQESSSSVAYRNGTTFNYNYRINGPTFPLNRPELNPTHTATCGWHTRHFNDECTCQETPPNQ